MAHTVPVDLSDKNDRFRRDMGYARDGISNDRIPGCLGFCPALAEYRQAGQESRLNVPTRAYLPDYRITIARVKQ